MPATLKIKGLRELQSAMRELGRAPARRIADAGLRAGTRVVVDAAKLKVPVRTGALKRAIGSRPSRRGSTGTVRAWILGVERPRSRIFHLLEFGTRHMAARAFFRPALDENAERALEAMAGKMRERLEVEAQKLAPKKL